MFRKIITCIILSLSFLYSIKAQRFDGGCVGGLSTSQIDGDTQKDFKKSGVFAGVFVDTKFNYLIGAKIELYYIGKGAKKKVDNYEEFNTTLHYVTMPFFVTFEPVKKFEFDIGIAVSYLIDSKLVQDGLEVQKELYDMHNFDFGGIASGSYFINKKFGVNVRFEYSIAPIMTHHNWFNSNLSFGVVYKFLTNNEQVD